MLESTRLLDANVKAEGSVRDLQKSVSRTTLYQESDETYIYPCARFDSPLQQLIQDRRRRDVLDFLESFRVFQIMVRIVASFASIFLAPVRKRRI